MHDIGTDHGLLHRGWQRVLAGERRWGAMEIRPDRFGVTRYRLMVYPPGISESARRRVRVARGWPLWGALMWVVSEIFLNQITGPWTTLAISTALVVGLGTVATIRAGDPRRMVKTVFVAVLAGHRDPVTMAERDRLENLAGVLMEADELLARGELSESAHELVWWRVYDRMGPASPRVKG